MSDGLSVPMNAPPAGLVAVGIQPGVSNGLFIGSLLIVFGPAGNVTGLFVYETGTTPGPGNGPVLSVTESLKDPYGNTVVQGIVSYAAPGSGSYAQLISGFLTLMTAGANAPGTLNMVEAGFIAMNSGNVSAGDSEASVSALSADANGGTSLVALSAGECELPPVTGGLTADTVSVTVSLTIGGVNIVSALSGQPTTTNGLPNGGIQGNSGAASAGTAHTHGPGGYSVTNGMHFHDLPTF